MGKSSSHGWKKGATEWYLYTPYESIWYHTWVVKIYIYLVNKPFLKSTKRHLPWKPIQLGGFTPSLIGKIDWIRHSILTDRQRKTCLKPPTRFNPEKNYVFWASIIYIYIILYYTILYYITLYYIILHYITLYYIILCIIHYILYVIYYMLYIIYYILYIIYYKLYILYYIYYKLYILYYIYYILYIIYYTHISQPTNPLNPRLS